MNGKKDRESVLGRPFPWQWDALGLPYGLFWGLEFDHSSAVDLGAWTSPVVFELGRASANPKVRAMEADISPDHFDSPLSHHVQQATALKFMRESRGFDPVVKMHVTYSDGAATLYLQAVTEFWEEVTE